MSISSIIHTGQSGLISAQTQIAVTSTNITNASTEGYTAKTASTATTVVGGQASGVVVIGVGNDIDRALMADVMSATSTAAYEATVAAYLESILSSLGTTADGSELEAATTDLMLALSESVSAGADAASLDAVETALADWSATLNATSASVQSARTAADEAIAESVEQVNGLLVQLDELNEQIARAMAAGTSTADLQDAQRVALEDLSSHLDVNYYRTGSGELRIYSAGGQALLTSSPQELSYAPYGPMTAEAVYDPASAGGVGGITVNGQDVTGDLTGGELGALIALRDDELPALQNELDAFALGVMDALNTAANDASPVPAPQSLTSATTVTAADPFSATGTLTVLETAADGSVVGATDIDLSTMATYQDLIDGLNAVPGVSAGLDANGNLVVSADTAGNGLVLTGGTSVGPEGESLSHHLGFNDVVSGRGASDIGLSSNLQTQGLPVAMPASTLPGETALADGDTSGLAALWTALDSPVSFEASGNLPATDKSAVAQVSTIIDDLADRTAAANDQAQLSAATKESLEATFDNAHGVNVDEETAKLVALEQAYQTSSQILATAQDMFDSLMNMMR